MAIQLNEKDKRAVKILGIFLLCFLIYQFVLTPLFSKKTNRGDSLSAKKKIYQEMLALKQEYHSLMKPSKYAGHQIKNENKDFSLYSFLYNLAGNVGIKDNINHIKPSTRKVKNSDIVLTLVEMKIQNITMNSLLSYLYKIETSNNSINIKRLTISKAGKKSQLINAVMQIEAAKT